METLDARRLLEPPPRIWCCYLALIPCLASQLACTEDSVRPATSDLPSVRVEFDAPLKLDDQGTPSLVFPAWVSEDAAGRYYIPDVSDRDIKVYDEEGLRSATIGSAGYGPGEFQTLRSAFVQGDSIVAYDLGTGTLGVFPAGRARPTRTLALQMQDERPPVQVRSADSLLIAVGPTQPPSESALLELVARDGQRLASFFEQPRLQDVDFVTRIFSDVQSDAHDGIAFASVTFSDSIYAFDYSGRLLASGLVDEVERLDELPDFGQLAEADQADWRSLMSQLDGLRWLRRIVALPGRLVALQVAEFDADMMGMLEGGTVIISGVTEAGHVSNLARFSTDSDLLGRDAAGQPLFLRYSDASYDEYELIRTRLKVRWGAQ